MTDPLQFIAEALARTEKATGVETTLTTKGTPAEATAAQEHFQRAAADIVELFRGWTETLDEMEQLRVAGGFMMGWHPTDPEHPAFADTVNYGTAMMLHLLADPGTPETDVSATAERLSHEEAEHARTAGARNARLAAVAAPASRVMSFYAFVMAQAELDSKDGELDDDTVVASFMGSGASDVLRVRDIRALSDALAQLHDGDSDG